MQQMWIDSDDPYDLIHTNDQGEDTNISEAFRTMIVKIDERLMRYLNEDPLQKLIVDDQSFACGPPSGASPGGVVSSDT